MAITQDELNSIISSVLSSIRTNSKTIEQMTPATSLGETDYFEVSGGKKVSYSVLKELISSMLIDDIDSLRTQIESDIAELGLVVEKTVFSTYSLKNGGSGNGSNTYKVRTCGIDVRGKEKIIFTSDRPLTGDSHYVYECFFVKEESAIGQFFASNENPLGFTKAGDKAGIQQDEVVEIPNEASAVVIAIYEIPNDGKEGDIVLRIADFKGYRIGYSINVANSEIPTIYQSIADKENVANKVTSINADADDAHYPSAKAVKEATNNVSNKIRELECINAFKIGCLISDGWVNSSDIGKSIYDIGTGWGCISYPIPCKYGDTVYSYDGAERWISANGAFVILDKELKIIGLYQAAENNTSAYTVNYANAAFVCYQGHKSAMDTISVQLYPTYPSEDGIFLKGRKLLYQDEGYINGIYKSYPLERYSLDCFLDLSISNSQENHLYWIQVFWRNENHQQLTFFYTTQDAPSSYKTFALFKDSSVIHTGIHEYSATLEDGASAIIVFNWDLIPVNENIIRNYYPDQYTFKDEVYLGGIISKLLRPDVNELDTRLSSQITSINSRIETIIPSTDRLTWAACGDSITNANHTSIYDIDNGDAYTPIDGYAETGAYKRKNYAYYIAKQYNLNWANYGWGGSTLHHCAPKAYNQNFNCFVDDRITELKTGVSWDYITIFFGWNDVAFGPTYQRDLWLTETYGTELGYPVTEEQVGTTGFATAEQKAACDAVIGSVGGVEYNTNESYFFAKFIGTINDNTKNTWMGAWNYAIDYLQRKYPNSKIMIVAPNVHLYSQIVRNSVKCIAEKWGVIYFDFEDLPYWYWRTSPNNTPFAPTNGVWTTENGSQCTNTITGFNQSRYSYDGLHPSNLGYRVMSKPFGDKLING